MVVETHSAKIVVEISSYVLGSFLDKCWYLPNDDLQHVDFKR